jgi:hypothetical protein
MNNLSHLLSSLCVTALVSFLTPVILVGGVVISLFGLCYLPGFEELGQIGSDHILNILATFGSGMPLQGLFTIGFACSLVGSLFELFNFYHYQILKGC